MPHGWYMGTSIPGLEVETCRDNKQRSAVFEAGARLTVKTPRDSHRSYRCWMPDDVTTVGLHHQGPATSISSTNVTTYASSWAFWTSNMAFLSCLLNYGMEITFYSQVVPCCMRHILGDMAHILWRKFYCLRQIIDPSSSGLADKK